MKKDRGHDVYIPPWVTMFTVFVQLTPRWDAQARDVLLGVLSSPYLHPKIAIAVDEDVTGAELVIDGGALAQ